MENAKYFYSSPIGVLEIQVRDKKIYSLLKTRKKTKSSLVKKEPREVQSLKKLLDRYFSGQRVTSWKVSLHPQGTAFQNKVWMSLRKIPYGKTLTYSQIAQKIGHPKAMRAVGSACGKNPWLILTPCHRVVAQNGLGGFALGLKTKKQMLQKENPNF